MKVFKTLIALLLLTSSVYAQGALELGALGGAAGSLLGGGKRPSKFLIKGTAADLFAAQIGQGGGHIVISYPPMMNGTQYQPQQYQQPQDPYEQYLRSYQMYVQQYYSYHQGQ